MSIPTAYDADPRVTATVSGWSFTWKGNVYFIKPDRDPDGVWDIVTADGVKVGYTDDPDEGLNLFLGPPQVGGHHTGNTDPGVRGWQLSAAS